MFLYVKVLPLKGLVNLSKPSSQPGGTKRVNA